MPLLTLDLPAELHERLSQEAKALGKRPQDRVRDILEREVAPARSIHPHAIVDGLNVLKALLARIPSVPVLGSGGENDPYWFVKLVIDIQAPLAWHVVQELGFVLNYISISERLPTVFMPVSPPPYLNGGPEDYLAWVIESRTPFLDPSGVAAVLEERLPKPLEDERAWLDMDGEEGDADEDE